MSDTANDDFEFLGRQLSKKSQAEPLRRQMQDFVNDHKVSDDLDALRRRAKKGEKLSEVVKQDRNERL